MVVDWHSIILSSKWLFRLEAQALKRFGQAGLAEEASTYVLDELACNDWQRCQQFTGKAKPETFLYTLTGNLLEEFARKRFGRPRPPEWLKREGDLWVSIWKRVCLERQLVNSIIDHLCKQGNRSSDLVSGIIRTIKAKLPWCGSSQREIPTSMLGGNDDDNYDYEQADSHTLEQQLDQNQLDDSLLLMSQLLVFLTCPSKDSEPATNALTMDNQQLTQFYTTLELSEEERLLLKMAYQEGIKLNAIAKALNMPAYQPGRLLKGILERIEQAMIDSDLPMDEIKVLLQESQ